MKLHRSALFAGMLALGVAACGDDVQIVEPPPPPPPALNVSMSPQNQTVAIDANADFAVTVSGGVAGETASWTCASSNTGIAANPTSTPTGCRVTGAAAGSATVTATVTKGGETQSVAAAVTVVDPSGGAAEVSIFQVQAGGTGTALVGPAAGQIDVIVNLQRNDERPSGIQLVVIRPDGSEEIVGTQTFAASPAAEEGPDAQAVQQITFSLNTAEYDVVNGIGVPKYLNDPNYTLKVRLLGGPNATNTWDLPFMNEDMFAVTAVADNPGEMAPALDDTGILWHRGELTGRAIPVLYSGRTVTQVAMQVYAVSLPNTVGAQVGGTRVATEAPYDVTWPTSGAGGNNVGVETPLFVRVSSSVLSDGTSGPSQALTTVPPAQTHPSFKFLDNVVPTVSNFERALLYSQSYPISRWVGANHSFTFSSAAGTPDFSDGGVGRNRAHHAYWAAETSADIAIVESPNDLDETQTNSEYVLAVQVWDLVGNETIRWWDGSGMGLANTAGNRTLVDTTPGFRFGVDLTAPTIARVGGTLAQGDFIQNVLFPVAGPNGTIVASQYQDPQGAVDSSPSGFPLNPIHTRISREAPGVSGAAACALGNFGGSPSTCRILGTVAGQTGTAGSFDFAAGPYSNGALTDAYYRVEYRAMDDAGNLSDWLDYRVVRDVVAPVVGGVSFPGNLTPAAQTTFQASVVDNLDLAKADGFLIFAGSQQALRQTTQSLGSFGPPFAQTGTAVSTIPFIYSLQVGSTNAPEASTHYSFRVWDQARNASDGFSTPFPAPTTALRNFTAGGAGVGFNAGSEVLASSAGTVCWDTDGDGCPTNPSATTLTFSVTGAGSNAAGGPLANPFTRLTFYVGLDENNDGVTDTDSNGNFLSTSIGNASVFVTEDAPGLVRTYTWTMNATGALLGQSAGHFAAGLPVRVRAVGYAADGSAFTVEAGDIVLINLAVD